MEIEDIPEGSVIESMTLDGGLSMEGEPLPQSVLITLQLPNGEVGVCRVSMATLSDADSRITIEKILKAAVRTKEINWKRRLDD